MKYEEAAKRWGERQLSRANVAFDEVVSVYFDSYVGGGCETCGNWTEYEATVWFVKDGKKTHKDFDFYGMTEIMKELFEVSEEQ